MSDITTLSGSDAVNSSRTTINNNFQYLQECFRSNTAPASPRSGQLWIDSSGAADILKVRNRANSAWVTLAPDLSATAGGFLPLTGGTMSGAIAMGSTKITGLASGTASADAVSKSQVDARTICITTYLGTLSATTTYNILITPQSYSKITAAYLVTSTAVATSGATYWSFEVKNVTDTLTLQSGTGPTTPTGNRLTASTYTGGTATVANTPYSLAINQNNGDLAATIATSKVIQLVATKTGAVSNLSDVSCMVMLQVST